jgi:hypothetical protein
MVALELASYLHTRDAGVQQFVELLRSAIGAGAAPGAGRPE